MKMRGSRGRWTIGSLGLGQDVECDSSRWTVMRRHKERKVDKQLTWTQPKAECGRQDQGRKASTVVGWLVGWLGWRVLFSRFSEGNRGQTHP